MKNAESFKQWESAAKELDHLEGNDRWRHDLSPESIPSDFNPQLIQERLHQLDQARENCDLRAMMHLIRTALSRNLGGMGNVDLYRHSYTGSKKLIERYVESTLQTIEAIIAQSGVNSEIPSKDLLESILYSRQSFGRSALLLSGGGTYGMSHVGVLKALFEADLLPRIISGASAGSIVCAIMCTRTDEEMPKLISDFPDGDLTVFGDPKGGVLDHCRHLLTEGSWADIKYLKGVMRRETQDMTFQEAYNRTRRILNICVSTSSVYELPRLLNYVTAPNVMIWSAVAASCSVPGVFNAAPLLVKDPVTGEHGPWTPSPQHFIDGSVDNDLPMTRLSEMFNVNHFIVSQVNPHVVPFLSKDDHLSPDGPRGSKRPPSTDDLDWMWTLTTLARDETLHRLHVLTEMNVLPNLFTKLRSILSQKYSGDITILPEISMHDLPRLLSNPTRDFMVKSCLLGEKATWPKLSRIRDRCAVELALDRAVRKLRTRVVFSQSQRDLRTLVGGVGGMHILPANEQNKPEGKRHRRRSGGSVQILERQRLLAAMDDDLSDEKTIRNEATEAAKQTSPDGKMSGTDVPRRRVLKRASKSHVHVSGQMNELTGGFDFSRLGHKLAEFGDTTAAPAPKREIRKSSMDPTDSGIDGDTEVDIDMDIETSEITEMGQSSDACDADGEHGDFTEDSEVEDLGPTMSTKRSRLAGHKPVHA